MTVNLSPPPTSDCRMNHREVRYSATKTEAGAVSIRFAAPVILLTAAAIVAASGCGNPLVPISGKLIVDGEPGREGARVIFHPTGNTRMAQGLVGADGSFEMQTFQERGVMPGDYVVTLQNSTASLPMPKVSEGKEGSNQPSAEWFEWQRKVETLLANPPRKPGWIPKSYAELDKTPLRWSVPKDGPYVTFEVRSDAPGTKSTQSLPGS
jgi:hypothetical protein